MRLKDGYEKCDLCGHVSDGDYVFRHLWLDPSKEKVAEGFRTHLTQDEIIILKMLAPSTLCICSNRIKCTERRTKEKINYIRK